MKQEKNNLENQKCIDVNCSRSDRADLAIMRDTLKEALMPLYKDLLENVSGCEDAAYSFCLQWGRNFPAKPHSGILFVGRSVNGWVSGVESVDKIFGDGEDAAFNRHDQMQWVENLEGDKKYDTKRSAFWRVIKSVSKHFYPENWSSHVAWSNLCKVSPESGNPGDTLFSAQFEACQKILKTELEILSPKVVVFLTAKWDAKLEGDTWGYHFVGEFLKSFNDSKEPNKSIDKKYWGKDEGEEKYKYVSKEYKGGEYVCILTPHPERKPEEEHKNALIDLITPYTASLL